MLLNVYLFFSSSSVFHYGGAGGDLKEKQKSVEGKLFFLPYTCNGIVLRNIKE